MVRLSRDHVPRDRVVSAARSTPAVGRDAVGRPPLGAGRWPSCRS